MSLREILRNYLKILNLNFKIGNVKYQEKFEIKLKPNNSSFFLMTKILKIS